MQPVRTMWAIEHPKRDGSINIRYYTIYSEIISFARYLESIGQQVTLYKVSGLQWAVTQ